MKNLIKILTGYIPPMVILVFLLTSNLFTRVKFFKEYLFPEQQITVSVLYGDDSENDSSGASLPNTKFDIEEDSLHCEDPLYFEGKALYKKANYTGAILKWQKLADSSLCDRSPVNNSIGIAFLKAGNFREAERLFTMAISEDSGNALAWYNLGVCHSRRGRISLAADAYRQAVQIKPNLNKAHFNRGILLIKTKDYREARKHFRDALAWGASKAICWYHIALTYQREDSLDLALDGYRECIRFDPAQTSARLKMAEIYSFKKCIQCTDSLITDASRIDPHNLNVLLNCTRIAVDIKKYDKALQFLKDAEKTDPENIEIAYQQARIYGLTGKDKKALQFYKSIIARDPSNPRVHYNIGINLMDLGMDKEALAAYSRSLKIDPTYWKSAYNMGVYYLKKDQPDQAGPFFEKVIQVTPDRPQAHYNLGIAYLRAGNMKNARKAFSHAIEIDSSYIEGRYNLALTFMKDGNSDSAMVLFQSILQLSPNHEKSLFNIGLINRRNGDNRAADSCFYKAIHYRNGSYPTAWYNRALCKRDMGQLDSALLFVKLSVDRTPSQSVSATALLLQARLYDTLGHRDSASLLLRQADSLSGNGPSDLNALADFYTKMGNNSRASYIYRKLLKIDSTDSKILLAAASIEDTIGNPNFADTLFQHALYLDSENIKILLTYSNFLIKRKRHDDALRVLQNAVMLSPGSVHIRKEIALLYWRDKRYQEYEQEIAKIKRLQLTDGDYASIGKTLFMAGAYNNSQWFLTEAFHKQPGNKDTEHYLSICKEKIATNSVHVVRQ
jgi:tetratricopeptide (TPR) repeat protein